MIKNSKKTYFLLCIALVSFYKNVASHTKSQKNHQSVQCMTQQKSEESFLLDTQTHIVAKHLYSNLNFSPLFKVQNLLNPEQMRSELLSPFIGEGELITATTADGFEVQGTFFNRNSDTLLVIGTGFGNEREKVASFVHMFSSYDIIIFDYRGHGYTKPKLLEENQWKIKPDQIVKSALHILKPYINWNRIPNLDVTQTTFGESEQEDLIAILSHIHQQKKYNRTYGIALCFSSYIFSKVAARNPHLFNKLVLDSSLHSPQELIARIINSPQLLFDPQRSQWSTIINQNNPLSNIISQDWFTSIIRNFLRYVFSKVTIPPITTGDYLKQIKNTPILFFHGKKDLMTPYENDFLKNWNSFSTNKTAIILETTTHLTNHIKEKELYKLICTNFFEMPYNYFIESLKKPEKLVQYKIDELEKNLTGLIQEDKYAIA